MKRALVAALLALSCSLAWAEPRRVVVLKIDGLPANLLQEVLQERDPATGRSQLPWIEEVFGRNGTRAANFYVRGISLSAPSWAMLDTGRHQLIHGNVEYDRYTLRAYDYLNFIPFYLKNASGKRADMPGVEVLDASRVPLVIDRFPPDERYQSFQLFQRWVRWKSLQKSLENRFLSRSPHELLDEWETGFDLATGLDEQTERELLARLADPHCLYLDLYSGEFDHLAHLNNNRAAQVSELRHLDAMVGRLWTAIRNSSLADDTVLVLVSDHGINSVPGIYSQGYSLVDWFRSFAGGGHHTATDRYPLTEFKVKGLNPLVSEVVTASPDSSYLKGESRQYPTAFLDVDGNERAAIQLRNSDLNMLHILLKQLARGDLSPRLRQEATRTFFEIRDEKRAEWQKSLDKLRRELTALYEAIARARAAPIPKQKWTADEKARGLDRAARRAKVRLATWEQDERDYSEYARVMSNLLSVKPAGFDPRHARIEDLIPKRSLGERNSIYDLQNYVVGPSVEGIEAGPAGEDSLDLRESFRRIDYFAALRAIEVRNNVQKDVGPRPVDFIAAPVPVPGAEQAVWLYSDETHQALVLGRHRGGELQLRYLPVSRLQGLSDGSVSWSDNGFQPGLPLAICEDPALDTNGENREIWLGEWHSDRDWLRATHRTRYSDGIIGIYEQFISPEIAAPETESNDPLGPYEAHRRHLVEPDLVLFANDHWNFNIRSFNPGGNHGSFLRISTHSVLMFAGGSHTRIPRGLTIQEPYDSLSFAPTLLKLAGHEDPSLPGPLIQELFPPEPPGSGP